MGERKNRIRFAVYFVLLSPLAACSCEDETLTPHVAGSCEPTFECPTGFDYRLGECHASRCQIDADCCPGQKCNAAAGFCADQFVSCTDDSQCDEVPGQSCIEFRGGMFCGYPNAGRAINGTGTQSCLSQVDCEKGRTCFGTRCVVFAPCMGGCPTGQICDVDSNTCFDQPTCTQQCAQGQILIVADPDTMSGPHCCKVDCKCETLPPIRSGQFGWFASLGLPSGEVAVAAYDAIYGDLVVAHFDRLGALQKIEYVDGFPLDGPIVANPDGPRGGRDQPGPNVGEHASLAVDANNTLHIAYYDRTEGQLKYANNSGGLWKTSVVDNDGNVGLYTSIQLGPDGNPRISYMLAEGTVSPDPTKLTGLKYATAHAPLPTGPSDWTIELVDSKPLPIPPCNGGCGAGEACIDNGMGPACVAETTGCNMCASNEACIDNMGTPECTEKVALVPIDDLIDGTGLFSSLAFTSTGTPVIAYYDRLDGDLRLAAGRAGSGFTLATLDGNDPMNPTDVGQHASLAVGPMDTIGVAYFDATSDDLVYIQVGGAREIVDNGVTPPDLRLVGADASLIFDDAGQPAIAYQDPTNLDLLYARRSGNPALWSTEVLRGAPPPGMDKGTASGFYASQKRDGAKTFISNVDVSFDPEGNLLLTLSVLMKELL